MPDEPKNTFLFIETPLGPDKILLRSFTGREALSSLFSFQLDLVSLDQNIKFDDIVGKSVTIGVKTADGTSTRFWNGVIASFSQLQNENRLAVYRAELVPWFWFLTRQSDCRIFEDVAVPDIIQDVFHIVQQDKYLDMKVVSSNFRVWEYCVQYRETTCNFLMRLMEQEGIFFYFTHVKGRHRLVVADGKAEIDSCQKDAIKFAPRTAAGSSHRIEGVTSWQLRQEVRTGKFTLNDFNFQDSSSTLLKVESNASHGGDSRWEIYDYPGEFDTHDEGVALADIYMEAEEVPHLVMSGESICRSLMPGFSFQLDGHPRSDQNGGYLLTSVFHAGSEASFFSATPNATVDSYSNTFICIPIAVPFSPPRVTPKPLMQGSQTATVVGPEGEEIFCDKFGRVKVRFHWDRLQKRTRAGNEVEIKDEQRSAFIRVSQVWAGNNWGSIFIPRIGQEVIVDFLEGDPDQPIITGRVYNDKNMPPYKLPDNQTRSGIVTRSTPKGSSSTFNSIIFEDKKGSELLRIHAERSKTESVEADSREYVGNDRLTTIGNDRKTLIKKNDNLHVQGNSRILIESDASVHIQDSCAIKIDQQCSLDATNGWAIHASKISLNVDQEISINGPGGFIKIDASGVTIMGMMVKINSGGAPSVNLPVTPKDPEDPDEKHGGVKNS